MSNEETMNILKIIAALTGLLTVALPTFYLTVVRPLLAQVIPVVERLIDALNDNTTATDTSATALEVLAPAVDANTVVTRAVADATAPASPVTVNVSGSTEPTPIRPT